LFVHCRTSLTRIISCALFSSLSRVKYEECRRGDPASAVAVSKREVTLTEVLCPVRLVADRRQDMHRAVMWVPLHDL